MEGGPTARRPCGAARLRLTEVRTFHLLAPLRGLRRWCSPTYVLPRPWSMAALLGMATSAQGVGAGVTPAACGRRRFSVGAQPCSCTPPPMQPAWAAVGGSGGGVWWPHQERWRPRPRGGMSVAISLTEALLLLLKSFGRCRCQPSADAPYQRAVGRRGFGRLGGGEWSVAASLEKAIAAPAVVANSLGSIAGRACCTHSRRGGRARAPSLTLLGCCRLDHTAEALSTRAVGRFGIGQFEVLKLRAFLRAPASDGWNSLWRQKVIGATFRRVRPPRLAAEGGWGGQPMQRSAGTMSSCTSSASSAAFHTFSVRWIGPLLWRPWLASWRRCTSWLPSVRPPSPPRAATAATSAVGPRGPRRPDAEGELVLRGQAAFLGPASAAGSPSPPSSLVAPGAGASVKGAAGTGTSATVAGASC